MKHVFILNPKAGKYNVEQLKCRIDEVFIEYDYVIEVTKEEKDASAIAKRYAQTGLDLCLYACGGDGTIHEVVNGMYLYPNAKLAIFPIGTGNDFIKTFDAYCQEDFLNMHHYKNPYFVKCDVLQVGEYIGINTVSFGLDVAIAKNVAHFKSLPLLKGVVPYYLSLLYSMSTSLSHAYRILLDHKNYDKKEYTFVVAGNGRYYGGGFCPAPNASINDGVMDICMISKVTRRKIIALAGKYKQGKHTQYKDLVCMHKAKHLQILSDDKVSVNIDGEVKEMINPTITILPAQICLCLPNCEENNSNSK